jgi:hypothetical protein
MADHEVALREYDAARRSMDLGVEPPPPATVEARVTAQAAEDGGPLALPSWDAVVATPVSTYVEPPAVVVDVAGNVLGPAPESRDTPLPDGALVLAITPGVPPILSLPAAVRRLLDLTPRDLAILQYIRKPNRSLVVAYGALCVLLDTPTTWPDALRAVSDPHLVDKLVHLSGLPLSEGRAIAPDERQAFAMRHPDGGAGASFVMQLVAASPAGPSRAASPTSSSPVPRPRGVAPAQQHYGMRITGKALSLARKLLNKRPDIRAEVRAMAVTVAPRSGAGVGDGRPFTMACNGLVALVEWLCAFTLHHTDVQMHASGATRSAWAAQLNARTSGASSRLSGAQSTELGFGGLPVVPEHPA